MSAGGEQLNQRACREREWADRPPEGTAGQHSLCSQAGQDAGRPDKVVAAKEIVHNTNIKVQEQLV